MTVNSEQTFRLVRGGYYSKVRLCSCFNCLVQEPNADATPPNTQTSVTNLAAYMRFWQKNSPEHVVFYKHGQSSRVTSYPDAVLE